MGRDAELRALLEWLDLLTRDALRGSARVEAKLDASIVETGLVARVPTSIGRVLIDPNARSLEAFRREQLPPDVFARSDPTQRHSTAGSVPKARSVVGPQALARTQEATGLAKSIVAEVHPVINEPSATGVQPNGHTPVAT